MVTNEKISVFSTNNSRLLEEAADDAMMNTLVNLLAEKNIQVVVSERFHTAFFDLKNRFIGIPAWKNMSRELKMVLRFHEVSHELFSDVEGFHDFMSGKYSRKLAGIINVCEDDRVDRTMQKKFPGAKKYYQKGYEHFLPEWIKMSESGNISFPDRLNLDSKAKQHFPFSPENEKEASLYVRFKTTQTVDEVVALAKDILEYLKEEHKKQQEKQDKAEDGKSGDQKGSEENQDSGNSPQMGDIYLDDDKEDSDEKSESGEGEQESDETTDGNEPDQGEAGTIYKKEKNDFDENGSSTQSQEIMDEKIQEEIDRTNKEDQKENPPNDRLKNNPMGNTIILKANKSNFTPYKTIKKFIEIQRKNVI